MAIHNVVIRDDLGRGLDINDAEQKINVKVDNATVRFNSNEEIEAIINPFEKFTAQFTQGGTDSIVISHNFASVAYVIARVTTTDGITYHPNSNSRNTRFDVYENNSAQEVIVRRDSLASNLDDAKIEVFVYLA